MPIEQGAGSRRIAAPQVMALLTAARGAINGMMAEVVEDHIQEHMMAAKPTREESQAADELIDVLRSYIR